MVDGDKVENFHDGMGNPLKVNDIVVCANFEDTRMFYGRVTGFTGNQVKVYPITYAMNSNAVFVEFTRKSNSVCLINRNEEISKFHNEWLCEFYDNKTHTFDWSAINSQFNVTT